MEWELATRSYTSFITFAPSFGDILAQHHAYIIHCSCKSKLSVYTSAACTYYGYTQYLIYDHDSHAVQNTFKLVKTVNNVICL